MILSIIVYLFLSLFMIILCRLGGRLNKWIYVIIAVFLYSIIFGVRYGVGVDYFNYLFAYIENDYLFFEKEQGFLVLIYLLHGFGAHFAFFFGIVAFVQLFLCFRLVKGAPDIYTWFVITFMLGGQWLVFGNGLRQEVAFAIFAMSLIFIKQGIKKNDVIFHFLLLILATLFHKSAILLILVSIILIFKIEWFSNIKTQLLLFVIAFLLPSESFITMFIDQSDSLINYLGYNIYIENDAYSSMAYREIDYGLGFYISQIVNLVCITQSNTVKRYYMNKIPILSIYNLFYFGLLWTLLFSGSLILNRINYYFYQFQFIFAAATMAYLFKYKKKHLLYLMIICYVLLFVAKMYRANENTALYHFFWDYM